MFASYFIYNLGAWSQPRVMMRSAICTKLERQFDAEEFKIGGDFNTSFVVAVFDFTTPILLQVRLI